MVEQQQPDIYSGMSELEKRFVDALIEVFGRAEFAEVAGNFDIGDKLRISRICPFPPPPRFC